MTGGASGLGTAIARQLSHRGYLVHVTDLDGAAATEAAGRMPAGSWGSALDVCDPEACRTIAQATAERAGDLSVWINNAGVLRVGRSWEQSAREWREMLAVNTEGTINGTTAALEVMRPSGRGHIINVVSLAGIAAPAGEAVYAASKHAALAFTLGTLFDLREAGLRGIELSALCPDGIWTPMLHRLATNPQAAASWIGTMLDADAVARVAIDLIARPRPIRTYPRGRGFSARAFAALPRMALAVSPLLMANARRKQRRFLQRMGSSTPARDPDGAGSG